jgi:hypothetical protein
VYFALIATLIVEIAGDNPAKAVEILSALLALFIATVLLRLDVDDPGRNIPFGFQDLHESEV